MAVNNIGAGQAQTDLHGWWVESYGPTMLLCVCGTSLHDRDTATAAHERETHSSYDPASYTQVEVTPQNFHLDGV